MSGFSPKPRSNNPNAPQIQRSGLVAEKADIAGSVIGAIGYGMSAYAYVYLSSHSLLDLYRDRHRSILQMYERVAQPCRSHTESYPVATCGSHRGDVLVCDGIHRDVSRPPIHLLHRYPRVSRQQQLTFRAHCTPAPNLLRSDQPHSPYHVLLEQLAGRWPFGAFCVQCSCLGV